MTFLHCGNILLSPGVYYQDGIGLQLPLWEFIIGSVMNKFLEGSTMNKRLVLAVSVLLTGAVAWTAFGQPQGGGRGGFGRNREAQQKAIAAMQEDLCKLKAMLEQQPGAGGCNFQDMTDEERTKMREEMTQRREQQTAIMASLQQQMDTLKGGMQLATEHREAMTPLNELLASAKSEKATATAAMVQKLIDERQKQFEAKMTAMGYEPEMMQRMMERMGQGRGQRGQ